MENEKISPKNVVILTGRIYPAIKACVNNRYKIVLAFFAYYSFILNSFILKQENSSKKEWEKWVDDVNWYASIIFTLFILLNILNYGFNAHDQLKREGEKKNWIWAIKIEFFFFWFMFFMIWSAYRTLHLSFN